MGQVNDMNTKDFLVGRGSRTRHEVTRGTAFCRTVTSVRPLHPPSRARRVANTHSYHGALQTAARRIFRPKTSLDLTQHILSHAVGSFGSLALPIPRLSLPFEKPFGGHELK